jgi:pSer/pThr/pTyr-binding forkhead associated (FHA) protein
LREVDGQVIDQHLLDKAILNIGRKWGESDHEIQIPSQYIARQRHAQIIWENGIWSIKSISNKHGGMRYNGQMVTQHTFVNGDRIYLAPGVALIYQILP